MNVRNLYLYLSPLFFATWLCAAPHPQSSEELDQALSQAPSHVMGTDGTHHQHSKQLFQKLKSHFLSKQILKIETEEQVSTENAMLTRDLKSGSLTFCVSLAQRRTDETDAPLDEKAAMAVVTAFIQTELDIKPDEYILDGISQHMMSRENGTQTLEDIGFHFRRVLHGKPCYGPGTTASIQVGREGTINQIFVDWPALSPIKERTKRLKADVLTEASTELSKKPTLDNKTKHNPSVHAAYVTHINENGQLEFVPSLAMRGKSVATPVQGGPRFEPKFVQLY